jgi:hypothetical protein
VWRIRRWILPFRRNSMEFDGANAQRNACPHFPLQE